MSDYRPGLCHLNGSILPLEEARIDPRDRGFLFGDAIYEGLKVLQGTILYLEAHLERLKAGLERLRIPAPADLGGRCRELVSACRLDTGFLYLQVTRGSGPRSRRPRFDLEPTVFLEATPREYDRGASIRLRVATMPDPRWIHPDIKSTSLAATVAGKILADDAAADEILFVGEQQKIREGGSSNLFVRHGGVLETHPLDGRVLPGVTRKLVLALADGMAEELGLRVEERAPRLDQCAEWSEAFLTGTITGLQPIVELDDRTIGDGNAGPWTRALGAALDDLDERRAAGGKETASV
jgi:D-alanine transaminase